MKRMPSKRWILCLFRFLASIALFTVGGFSILIFYFLSDHFSCHFCSACFLPPPTCHNFPEFISSESLSSCSRSQKSHNSHNITLSIMSLTRIYGELIKMNVHNKTFLRQYHLVIKLYFLRMTRRQKKHAQYF